MSEQDIFFTILVSIVAGASYFIGHKKGISNTVDFLEGEGILEFNDT